MLFSLVNEEVWYECEGVEDIGSRGSTVGAMELDNCSPNHHLLVHFLQGHRE
jgi:hypothetical protein